MKEVLEILPLVSAIAVVVLSLFVFFQKKKNPLASIFFLLNLAIGIWLLGTWLLFKNCSDPEKAVFWDRFIYYGVVFIPAIAYHFSCVFAEVKRKISIVFGYLLSLLFFLAANTKFFLNGLYHYPSGVCHSKAQFLHSAFLFYFFIYIFMLFLNLYRVYETADYDKRNQAKYVFWAFAILGLMGSSGFLSAYGADFLYSFAYLAGLVSVAVLTYAIMRHHLFDVKIIVTEVLVSLIVLSLFTEIFLVESVTEFAVKFVIFSLTALFGALLIRSVLKEVRTREELENLTKKLKLANARLRQLDEAKSEFISVASHQLRAPLTSIKGYSSMILEGAYGRPPEKIKKIVERIYQSSQRLILTIGDFLDISRIESGKMKYDFADFDFKDLVKSITDDFAANIKNKEKVFLKFASEEGDFKIRADYGKIRQVVSNLVDNAVKYTPKGLISVSLKKDEAAGKVLLKIEDSGIGISPETIPALFQKFSRAKGISKLHTDGSGLGLYVASEMVKAHKGRIWVESKGRGKGSAFFVELPVSPPVENRG